MYFAKKKSHTETTQTTRRYLKKMFTMGQKKKLFSYLLKAFKSDDWCGI